MPKMSRRTVPRLTVEIVCLNISMNKKPVIIPDANFSLHPENYDKLLNAVEIGNTPRFLYKYMSINRFKQFLSNGKLLFSRYDMLNDPFECISNVRINYSYNEWMDFLYNANIDIKSAQSESLKLSRDMDYARYVIYNALTTSLSKDGFLCLTHNYDNLLMWAHYADSHTGVCLEFDITMDLDTFYSPLPVKYTQDYPYYDYIYDKGGAVRAILHKSLDWSYEEEYRIIKPGGFGLRKITSDSLTSVIFGCQFDKELFPEISSLVKSASFKPQYKIMRKSTKEYKLLANEWATNANGFI